jgi:hypothetical protein
VDAYAVRSAFRSQAPFHCSKNHRRGRWKTITFEIAGDAGCAHLHRQKEAARPTAIVTGQLIPKIELWRVVGQSTARCDLVYSLHFLFTVA